MSPVLKTQGMKFRLSGKSFEETSVMNVNEKVRKQLPNLKVMEISRSVDSEKNGTLKRWASPKKISRRYQAKATSDLQFERSPGSRSSNESFGNGKIELKVKADDKLERNEKSMTSDLNDDEAERKSSLQDEQGQNEEMIYLPTVETDTDARESQEKCSVNKRRKTDREQRSSDQEDKRIDGEAVEKKAKVLCCDIKAKKKQRNPRRKDKPIEINDDQTFPTEKRKQKHIFQCEDCKAKFHKRHLLHNHRFIYHKETKIECKNCGKLFPTQARLLRHLPNHEGHKCPQCEHRYMKISDLNRHVSIDHVSLATCPECGRTFRHKQRLRKHRKIHEANAVRIPCTYEDCPRTYTLKRNLDAHIRSFHLGQRYPCTVSDCTFILSTKQKLEAHLRLHCLQRVEPHFSRQPRDDRAIEQRQQRRTEELRLKTEALRERQRAAVSWWEGSSVNEDSNWESDSSLAKFLKEDHRATAERPKETPRKKKRRRSRRRAKHLVDLDTTTTDYGTTAVESDDN